MAETQAGVGARAGAVLLVTLARPADPRLYEAAFEAAGAIGLSPRQVFFQHPVDSERTAVEPLRSAERLSVSPDPETLSRYLGAMAQFVPHEETESPEDLLAWLSDSEDPFDITPVMKGAHMEGGAHTQVAPGSPFGSLEYFWGADIHATRLALAVGIDALATFAQESGSALSGVVADVPLGSESAAEMSQVLRENGFLPVYDGAQPPLGEGEPPTNVRIFFRPAEPGRQMSKREAAEHFRAYWSTFASIDGDEGRLEADPAFQRVIQHIRDSDLFDA